MDETPQPVFTQNWTSELVEWARHLVPFAGRVVRALEIGCFEGRSALWLLDNILTHPYSVLDCVDPFVYKGNAVDPESMAEAEIFNKALDMKAVRERFESNVLRPHRKQVRLFNMTSDHFFEAKRGGYEIIVVDGSHSEAQASRDLFNCWRHLTAGGVMIVDDIGWEGWGGFASQGPRKAFASFQAEVGPEHLDVLHYGYTAFVTRR